MNLALDNGWTGGQYSLYRVVLGSYLFLHFAMLLPWGTELFSDIGMLPDAASSPLHPLFPNLFFVLDSPEAVLGMLAIGAGASLCLAAGTFDRASAVLAWYVLACLFSRNPLIANPSLPFIGWLLLAHALLPAAPYGSWSARRRVDPGGGWRMPPAVFAAAWIVMALGYSYSGYTKLVSPSWIDGSAVARVLDNPLARPSPLREMLLGLPPPLLMLATWGGLVLELLFAPLACFRFLRPWLWGGMLSMHLGLMLLIDFADLSFGMVVLHAFTFDPAWVRTRSGAGEAPARVFYDGGCGLCHGVVRFLLAEDRDAALRFAPLEGEAFGRVVPEDERRALPDSIVLVTSDGTRLTRSGAVREMGHRLGGLWRLLALAAGLVPSPLLDAVYDGIAGVRHRLVARRIPDACPLLPPHLRARFEA